MNCSKFHEIKKCRVCGNEHLDVVLDLGDQYLSGIFPKEIVPTPREWAKQIYTNNVYWNELEKGGHFPAFEQPALFIEELRNCFRQM